MKGNLFQILRVDSIDLRKNYIFTTKRIVILRRIIIFILLFIGGNVVLTISRIILQVPIIILIVYLSWLCNQKLRKIFNKIFFDVWIRDKLRFLMVSNKLYTTEIKNNRRYVTTSGIMEFEYQDKKNVLIIKGICTGNQYTDRMRNLENQLTALFNLDLEKKINKPNYTEYIFYTIKPKRLILNNSAFSMELKENIIDLGYGIKYCPSETPHILLSGGTGSGKSLFISYLILEFLKREAALYIIYPKNSDLGSLSYYLGEKYVAYQPTHIARIVREVIEIMNQRYKHMREHFIYGANYEVHGFKQMWLLFDEMAGFMAIATDRKSREVTEEVMNGIKQIILLGRQAGVFVLISAQQMNATVLSTELRDNLGLRIALGANSAEGYKMVLGSTTKELKPIETIGGGYLYLQGSGEENSTYYETPFIEADFNFIKELKKYI